jgi:hypothetical protein
MEGTYELRSGYELEIQALDSYDCQDGYVEMEFDVVVHTPSWLSNFYPTLTFRFTVDGQNVYVYWDQDDDCCSECASNLYPDLVDDLKERAIKTIFRLLAEGVEALLGGAVGSDEISSLEQSLMAAGDDPAAIQSTLSNAMQNLAIGFQVPNSILTYVNLTNVFAQTLLAELRVFGTMETPKFSWPDDDKYEAWIDGDMWEKGGPPRQRGRRQSYVVFPSQRQRMMALIKPPKKAGGASWLDTANDMADKVGAIVQEPEWWHINLQAETYNMVEPFFVKWEFACADPSEMVAAANGMQATVYVNPLAEGLNCKATLTLSDSFAHTVVCEKDLGWPRIKPRPGAGAPVDYFGEILDKLRMLGFTVAGEEGGKPGVKPEVDPEVRKLLIELEAMQQMKQRRRG